jgi:hypothetical protein
MLRQAARQLLLHPLSLLATTLVIATGLALVALPARQLAACLPELLVRGGGCTGDLGLLALGALLASALGGAALATTLGERPPRLSRLDALASGGLLGIGWLLATGLGLTLASLGLASGLELAAAEQHLAAAAVIAATVTPAVLATVACTGAVLATLWGLAIDRRPGAGALELLAGAMVASVRRPTRLLAATGIAALGCAPLLVGSTILALRMLLNPTSPGRLPLWLLLALLLAAAARFSCAVLGSMLLDAAPTANARVEPFETRP